MSLRTSKDSLVSLLFASAAALGLFAACSDSSSADGDAPAAGGADSPAGGAPATPSAGTASRAGSSASGGTHAANGGSYAVAGTSPTAAGGASDSAGAGLGGEPSDSAGAAGAAPCVPEPPTLPTDVAALIVAPEGVTLLRHFHAIGTQNYRCAETPGDAGADPTFAWSFIGPKANMQNSCGKVVGTHFAAPNTDPPAPEWQYDIDGSSVVGAKVAQSNVANAIPELLLKQVGHGGNGVFSAVTFVQRLQTAGGAAPAATTVQCRACR